MNFILLVEDNPDDAELTKRAIKKSGVRINMEHVQDGQQALDFLFGTGEFDGRDISKQPVLILLDLNLPKVNGISVLKRIRADERTQMIPVIALTSSTEHSDLTAAYRSFVNSYIRKPVDFDEFIEAVRQLGLYWLVLNRPPPTVTAP